MRKPPVLEKEGGYGQCSQVRRQSRQVIDATVLELVSPTWIVSDCWGWVGRRMERELTDAAADVYDCCFT